MGATFEVFDRKTKGDENLLHRSRSRFRCRAERPRIVIGDACSLSMNRTRIYRRLQLCQVNEILQTQRKYIQEPFCKVVF